MTRSELVERIVAAEVDMATAERMRARGNKNANVTGMHDKFVAAYDALIDAGFMLTEAEEEKIRRIVVRITGGR